MYQGSSIVDYLKSISQPYDYASRATLAASKGITGYIGSAEQNTNLLNLLRGGGASTTPTAPNGQPSPQQQPQAAQASQPQTQMTAQTASNTSNYQFGGWYTNPATGKNQRWWGDWGWTDGADPTGGAGPGSSPGGGGTSGGSSGGGTSGGVPPVDMSFYPGWNDQAAIQADWNATWQQKTGGGGASGISGLFNQPTINLPELYEGLFASSGIKDIEADLSAKTKSYNEAVSKIKDNPYLSEATMTGRLSKLAERFNADTANIRNDIAMKRADIETKLNIQMKQFDINSQQAQLAFNQFQTLLSSGALNNASGEDIANITRATGLSSAMIMAAIKAQKDKSVQTSIIQWDDGTNQGFSVVNSNTGEIISSQTVAASKPKATGGGSSTANIQAQFLSDASLSMTGQNIGGQWWGQFALLVRDYAPYMSLQKIYELYAQSELGKKFGKPTENAAEMKQLYDYIRSGKEPE